MDAQSSSRALQFILPRSGKERLRVLRIFFEGLRVFGMCCVIPETVQVGQQVLATFLRVSLSRSIQRRTGFVPIAITRTVRKIVFRWAFREVHEAEIQKEPGSSNSNLARPDPFESYLLLRDFFQHCERTGVLAASEQQVLTRLKLEGLSAKQLAKLEGSTSEEAVHHRSYRIMARLRKAASRLRSHAHP